MNEKESDNGPDYWYVLRDMKRPNAKDSGFKALLKRVELKGRLFIPFKQKIYCEFGKHVRYEIPFYQDLIFVGEELKKIADILEEIPALQFRYVKGKRAEAMKIRNDSMQYFIKAVAEMEKVRYYSIDEVSPQLYGKNIRIIGGRLDGYEGRLMSKRGSKVKRLILDLKECNLAAAIQVEPEYIQLVK